MQEGDQQMSQPLTSEVGPAQAHRDSEWRSLLEAQNLWFIEILKTMQQPASTTTSEKSLRLPKFNPDAAEADASAWRKTADMILTEHPLEGSALVMSLSGTLGALPNGLHRSAMLVLPGHNSKSCLFSATTILRRRPPPC